MTPHDAIELSSQLIPQVIAMQEAKIFVAGDLLLDVYIEGRVTRISPEAPVPVVLEKGRRFVLGGAGNVAANVADFGGRAYLCGRVGFDPERESIEAICTEKNIDFTSLIASHAVPTTRKTRVLAGYQQLVRVDREVCDPLSAKQEEEVAENFGKFLSLPGEKALVLSDYGKGFLTLRLISTLIAMARAHEISIVTDPKSLDLARYEGSTLIKPNLSEGRDVQRRFSHAQQFRDFDEEVETICDNVLKLSGASHVVMSLSEHGVVAKGREIPRAVRFASQTLAVADVSGAGDTMIAFLAMGMAAKIPLPRAVAFGNMAAGVVCGKLGTSTLTADEFLSAFRQGSQQGKPDKFVELKELSQLVAQSRSVGKKIVFTNGCFDILHAGHVQYLQKARELGDVLVVGLNSDASVKRLKGVNRPIQEESDRALILAGLACVDYVVLFESDTPLDLILTLRPDVLVKGGDWAIETIVGAKEVKSWGGHVASIPLLEGRSTTRIVERSQI